MSLCAQSTFLIPVETERVARVAFPKGALFAFTSSTRSAVFSAIPSSQAPNPRKSQ
jgi:hypothetical protein